jgi:hypothetical protein
VCGKGGCEKRKAAVEEKMPTASLPRDPARSTVITQVEFSAAPESRQFCELTLNLMEAYPELIEFLVMLQKNVGRVHLTFDSDERNYATQFKNHVETVFAANDLPPFDFKACVAWPKVKTQIGSLLEEITDKLDDHSFDKSLKMPKQSAGTPDAEAPKPWPLFHDCDVKMNDHWAIVVCSKD